MLEPRALREPTAAAEGAAAGMAAAAAGSAVPAGAGMAEKKKDGNGRKGRKGKGPGKKPAPPEEGEAPGSATGKPVGRCGGRPARTHRALPALAVPQAAGASPAAAPARPGPAGLRAPRRRRLLAELPGPAERQRRWRCREPLRGPAAGRSAALPPTSPETLSGSRPAVAFFISSFFLFSP